MHRYLGIFGAGALAGGSSHPGVGLSIEVVDVGEGACSKEVVTDIANRALHPALLIAPGWCHRAWLEVVMRRECQHYGVEANGLPLALEHGALEVVVQSDPGHGTPGFKGLDVAAQEVLHVRAQEEAQKDASGPGQDHHKGHEWSLGLALLDVTKVPPVTLALFAGQGAQAQVGLGWRAWSVPGDEMAEVVGASTIASLHDHGVQATGGEIGKLL